MAVEIDFLRYYGYREDVNVLTTESNIYRDVRSIGYTKRSMPLYNRCSPVSITSLEIIHGGTLLESLYQVYTWDRDNIYTALEIIWMLFPERRPEILHKLTKKQHE